MTTTRLRLAISEIYDAIAHALPWGKIGAVVAVLAFTYGVTMSIVFVLFVYRSRGQQMSRRTDTRRRNAASQAPQQGVGQEHRTHTL
jgi:hypothetical protein